MKLTRSLLLAASGMLVLFLLGGGLFIKVGAAESSYRQVVRFSEVLSLVLENYVDPVDADLLLNGAYEGMLGGLDPNGAFLTPAEVAEWKAGTTAATADPGVDVLKAGSTLQVVAVDPGSPADAAGIRVGDHIRSVDGRPVAELSLGQGWRLLHGQPGTTLRVALWHIDSELHREDLVLRRAARSGRPYELKVERGIAVLRVRDLERLATDALASDIEGLRSKGVQHLLLDLRNLADPSPRAAAAVAGLFQGGSVLRLRDRAGKLVDSVEGKPKGKDANWPGSLAMLVNGATAGAGEALCELIHSGRGGLILGEPTYGLGAEPRLYELENGSGLLMSAALWETASGASWHDRGIQPDEVIQGKGDDPQRAAEDQLNRALDFLVAREESPTQRKAA